MVLLAFISHNCAVGLAFGSFGPLLASTEQHFQVSRAVATTGMSALTAAMGLFAPLVGGVLERVSIRSVLLAGAALNAVAYIGLAMSTTFEAALAMFVLMGAGVCLQGVIAPLTLVTRWFVTARARALSFMNLPILLFLTPFVIAEFLPAYGRSTVLYGMGSIFLVLIPLLILVIDHPEHARQKPWGYEEPGGSRDASVPNKNSPHVLARDILANPSFLITSISIGIMAGAGSAYFVHIIPFGVEQQMSLQRAALLLSILAGSGIAGTLFFGWFADRAGAPVALMMAAFFQATLWWGILQASEPTIFLLSALMGVCLIPINTLEGAAASMLFGTRNVSRVMGFSYLLKLPFLFSFAPLVGWLFDQTGNYRLPFLLMSILLFVVGGALFLLIYILRQQPRMVDVA